MIVEEQYGFKKNVKIAKFGYGSIKMSNAVIDIEKETFHDVILGSDFTGKKVGEKLFEPDVKYADQLEDISFVLRFNSIDAINSLINVLKIAKENIKNGLTQESFLKNNQ